MGPALGERSRPVAGTSSVGVVGRACGLTMVGGAACAVLAGGMTTLELFAFAAPLGLAVGAIAGLPLGAGIALWFARLASPPREPDRLVAQVAALGGLLALAVTVPLNVGTVLIQTRTNRLSPADGPTHAEVLVLALVALACIAASALVGRMCGYLLAGAQLRRWGIRPPDRLPPWRLDRARRLLTRPDPELDETIDPPTPSHHVPINPPGCTLAPRRPVRRPGWRSARPGRW